MSIVVTNVHLGQIDTLVDTFARLNGDGEWTLPGWLSEWRARLEAENSARWRWPFAAAVEKRQTTRADIIERQYAHLKDWQRSV